MGEEEDSHLGDFIEDRNALPPVDAASKQLLKEQIDEVLSSLTHREQRCWYCVSDWKTVAAGRWKKWGRSLTLPANAFGRLKPKHYENYAIPAAAGN